ncbi:MAG: ABC transporter substrate-binding protein [bacterium]|nr:ABC transporter substrate-binding protein [bacterium]
MTRLGALNLLAAATCVGLAMLVGVPPSSRRVLAPSASAAAAPASRLVEEDGRVGLRDAGGFFVPLADYRRILSASTVGDGLLLALAEPSRVVAFTEYGATRSPNAWRYAGKPTFAGIADVEAAVAFEPDLVLTNGFGAPERLARLREAGLTVFDLGEMRGISSLLANIEAVSLLLARPEDGTRLARRFVARMHALAGAVPSDERPAGIYLAVYGDSLLGGTTGTSFHDVLAAAGVRDAAAGRWTDWPRYTPEALLGLDPELIVTQTGMTATICAFPGLDRLRACGPGGRMVEVDGALLGDPGLAMLDAAETVFEGVHPRPRRTPDHHTHACAATTSTASRADSHSSVPAPSASPVMPPSRRPR